MLRCVRTLKDSLDKHKIAFNDYMEATDKIVPQADTYKKIPPPITGHG